MSRRKSERRPWLDSRDREARIAERERVLQHQSAEVVRLGTELEALRARVERADRELERADAVPLRDQVLAIAARMTPNDRGRLLDELSTMHRRSAPLAKGSS